MDTAPRPAEPTSYRDPDPISIAGAGHDFTFFPHGADRLKALVALIDGASVSLKAFYYEFNSDTAGTKVRDALAAAAARGVDVMLMVDDFGNDAGTPFFEPLIEAGGRFAIFSPKWGKRYLVRNHQKFAIADGVRVMTGGANISDDYYAPPPDNGWCDLAVVIEGPVVEYFTRWFGLLRDWVISEETGRVTRLRALRNLAKDWQGGDGPVRLLVGGPLVRRGHWAWVFRQDLVSVRKLDMVSAYFSPPRSFRRQIAQGARRGSVRMITAGKSDIGAAIAMARLLYGKLLRAGVSIAEFTACKLHMKLLVADDVSYVGSANLDKRSFRVNVELMVRIDDAGIAAALRGLIDHLETGAEPMTRERYAREATFFARLRWRLAYWLSLADYRISRAGAR